MKKDRMRPEEYLRLGNRFFAHVKDATTEKNGRTVLESKTTSGTLELKMWDYDGTPRAGHYLVIDVTDEEKAKKEFNEWRSIQIQARNRSHDYRIVDEEDVPEETRKRINRDRRPQLQAAMESLKNASPWNDKGLHEKLIKFTEENKKKFFNAPAAKEKHHNWRGGLFVHTAEVAENCRKILESPMNRFYETDSDALLLAAWFHDMGKMETYRMDGDSPEMDEEKESRIGHITLSNLIFSDFARKEGIPEETAGLVSHLILSHHERRDWGSPVEPQTIEAHILCRADYISSRMPD